MPHRFARGDFEVYFKGRGLDIGAGGDVLAAPFATVKGFDKPQGDAQFLRKVKDASYDFVYSSHCLEHMKDVTIALRNWCRVIKPGGFLYTVVPSYELYEKEQWPSRKNNDHKQSFSLKTSQREAGRKSHWGIYTDIEPLLAGLGVFLERVELEDYGYNYSLDPEIDQTQDFALAQICFVGKKP